MRLTVRVFVFIFIAIVLTSPIRFAYAAQLFDPMAAAQSVVQQAVTALTQSSQPAPAAPTTQELQLRSDLRDARSAQITSMIADTARAFLTAANSEFQKFSHTLSQTASAWSAFVSIENADFISKLSIVSTPRWPTATISAAVANAPPATPIPASALPTPRLATDTGASSGQSSISFPLAAGTFLDPSAGMNDYVTQDELSALSNNLRALIYSVSASSTRSFTDPQIAANGNGVYYGESAAPVTQLNNVTITNPTVTGLSAGAIPDLSASYLSTGGGTLTGAFSDTSTASSSFLGALGVGTTSPAAPFEIYGSNSSTNLATGGGIFEAITNADQTAGNFDSLSYREINSAGLEVTGTRVSGVFNSHVAGAESADLAFLTRNAGTLSEKMRILGNGNVGIGTTTPASTLSVQGTFSVTDASPSSVATLGTERTTDGTFTTDPSSSWSLGSGWSWDSVNNRAAFAGGTGPISAGNAQSGNFSPSTLSPVTIDAGGTGYTNGDIITISSGSADATYTATVSSGKVTGLTQISGGTAYTSGTGISTTGGTGSGLKVSINQIADASPLTQTITTNSSDPTTSYLSRLNGATISGVTYKVTFTIQNYSGSGSVKVDVGSAISNIYPYPSYYYRSNGTYTVIITSSGSALSFTPTADFVGAITNVSVTPVIPTATVASIKNTDGSTALEIRSGGVIKYNTFIGTGAGQNDTTNGLSGPASYSTSVAEGRNTGVGFQSMFSNLTGGDNTAYGAYSLFSNTTGNGNTALSYDSMYSNTSGGNNTAIGGSSLWANTTGSSNTAVGSTALHFNTTGTQNTAVGGTALFNNTTASNNTAVGLSALFANTAGAGNTAVGSLASQLNTTGGSNTTIGSSAGRFTTTGGSNTAVGASALTANITGSSNAAFGLSALSAATTSASNSAFGNQAMKGSTVGSLTISGTNNVAVGSQALLNYIDGSSNVAIGVTAMSNATTSKNSVAVGFNAGKGASTNDNFQGLTALGYQAGLGLANGSDYNTLLGYQAGTDITTGLDNIVVGPEVNSGGTHLTTGFNNILIGFNANSTSTSASNFLNIGGVLFGSLPATTSATSLTVSTTGKIAIGTTTPYARLTVWGADAASSTLTFNVVNSASTTVFAVFDGGNAQLSGTLTQSSDQRLKTNIQSLDASSSLSLIDALNPVTFNWIDPNEGTTPQLGFIAQQVQQIFPNLVSTTSPTSLTPDGTLGLNYIGLISPIVKSIQALYADLQTLEQTVAGFAQKFTTNQLCVNKSDGTPVCVTGDQLSALLAAQGQQQETSSPSPAAGPATTSPPTITIDGDNPAVISVGATYNDLGATAADSQGHSLDVETFLNGVEAPSITVDTSEVATDTIDYVATDTWGNTSTSSRTVIIEAAAQ